MVVQNVFMFLVKKLVLKNDKAVCQNFKCQKEKENNYVDRFFTYFIII